MKRKTYYYLFGVVVVVAVIALSYFKWVAPTRIGFVNYQSIAIGNISKANDNSFIKLKDISEDDLDKVSGCDMIFLNGMGLRIVEEQREMLKKLAEKGVPIYTSSATNPENDICNLDTAMVSKVRSYLSNGGKKNYRSLLNLVRKEIDRKIVSVHDPEPPVERARDIIYHPSLEKRDSEDDLEFHSIAEYESWLKDNKRWHEGGKKILLTGQMADPSDLILALEEAGMNVYPISSRSKFYEYLNDVSPDLVINLPHGRMGDKMVDWLKQHNVPLLIPLTVHSLVEDWQKDVKGMFGGMLSQSVSMPEIDGGVRSYAVFAQYNDEEGWRHSFAVPERLSSFVETVQKYLTLKDKANKDKKVAIYYFKGHGQGASMVAGGMEVAPSLYNFLVRLKKEGYDVGNLPANHRELEKIIMAQGAVLGTYSEGSIAEFMEKGNPEYITKEEFDSWAKADLKPEKYQEVIKAYGEFPGQYMGTDDGRLGIARIQFGNVVLLPQNAAGGGKDAFKIVHGTDAAPPYPYIASYLWVQHKFHADALIHFGTHGSLEFTPRKQIALSNYDWPDRLVGTTPHFYVYSIGNIGEGMIAKRRSYAALTSYLTPPFLESSVRGIYRELTEALRIYDNKSAACDCGDEEHHHMDEEKAEDTRSAKDLERASLLVKDATIKLGIHRDLGLDSIPGKPYTDEDIQRIANFAEELATEKITGELYTMGEPYEDIRITSSVIAMATDPIAYSVWALDKLKGRADKEVQKNRPLFTRLYLNPAKEVVNLLLKQPSLANDALVCKTARITQAELTRARELKLEKEKQEKSLIANIMRRTPAKDSLATEKKPKEEITISKDSLQMADAILEVERTIHHVEKYKQYLLESPTLELDANMNGLSGGYISPSPGGDPVANPNTLPTGRNMYSINAEATPSAAAWDKGIRLANSTIDLYRKRHNGKYPRKVSYTLWSGEFIETEGATIAQILYMLGVEPIRDAFGRVTDLRLIPSAELGRPRIDVVVQTSGQLRDLAASRLFLVNRAVEMAAAAKDDDFTNQVAEGVTEAEKSLLNKGVSPKDAREMATFRVFGGLNGGYGTGIQSMVESGDRWEKEQEIAETYIHNMGAFYGSEKAWEQFRQYAFEAALTRTDVVVQPRQSNTWGALSLDHVYEFMGGLNLSIRHVTGKDPDAYFSDYRNRHNNRVQELKEAIGVESRTTILNPTYIKEKMKGEASSAGTFAETIRNTYAWNVMKPSVIDNELWNEIYEVYVKDKMNLKVDEFFRQQNPAALEEITAVMLETVRKGYWKATDEQIREISKLHTDLVREFKPSCSGFVCDNAKLKDFIASKTDAQTSADYKASISKVREAQIANNTKGVTLKKEQVNNTDSPESVKFSGTNAALTAFAVICIVIGIIFVVKRRRRNG